MSIRISKSTVDRSLPQEADFFVWDTDLRGFGLKVSKGGRKSYVCQYRVGSGRSGRTRRFTIGAHGSPWTPETARTEAKRILAMATNGQDPMQEKQDERSALTVAELCDLYLREGCATKKASTIATDRGRIERHIKPLLGKRKARDLSRGDVQRFLQDVASGKTAVDERTGQRGRAIVRGGKGAATRTVGLLGGILSFAMDADLIAENPVRGVKRYADRKNERYLEAEELQRLATSLEAAERNGVNIHALNIIRLLILTGARKSEIQGLRWDEVDFERGFLRLRDSKTGQKTIPVNEVVLDILRKVPVQVGSEFVFSNASGTAPYTATPKVWESVRADADLENVRLHDLRHSYASIAVSSGVSLPVLGAILGHKDVSTTQRYAHLAADPVRQATDQIGADIARLMGR